MDKNILDLDDDKSNDGKDLSMSYVLTDALFILNSNYLNVLMSAINDEVDINVKTRLKFTLLTDLKEIYSSLCLFKSDDVLIKFKNLGFINEELVWLFQLNEIEDIFNKLESNEAIESVDKDEILKIILYYTNIKIWLCLIKKFKIVDRNEKLVINSDLMKAELQNIIQKSRYRENSQKNFKRNDFEVYWNELNKEELMHEKLGISMEKYFKTIISKTDQMLIKIFTKHIKFKDTDLLGNKVSRNKKYQIAYPLFQYLMPHKDNWYKNEMEYKKSNNHSGYSFDMLMAKRMERFIKEVTPKKI